MFFFFNDTATTEIYTLSLHDALPIFLRAVGVGAAAGPGAAADRRRGRPDRPQAGAPGRLHRAGRAGHHGDRKSTRLNSSHANISYAVFCLKKKKILLPP